MSRPVLLARRVFVRGLAASALVLPACSTAPKPETRSLKVLCIGFNYHELSTFGLAPLGSGNVAAEMAGVFERMPDSTVKQALDDANEGPCTRERLKRIVDDWTATIGPDDLAVIYYAGHGEVEDGGFHIITPDPFRVPIQDIISQVTQRNPYALVAFIDACRVPSKEGVIERRSLEGSILAATGTLSGGGGEISVRGENIALIYATELYSEAIMGAVDSWKSLFTAALENNLSARVDVMTLFVRIVEEVDANMAKLDARLKKDATLTAEDRARYKQQPWYTSSLHYPVYFAGKPPRFGRGGEAWTSIPH